jgi:two-component system, chemotaxis family, chemotaxis protein CheY
MKILLVDDNFVSRKLLKSLLKEVGECVLAASGEEGFEQFCTAHKSDSVFDLVCLDVMMPGLDGHETLARIREWEEKNGVSLDQSVKVIMITAMDDKKNVFQAFKGGCEAYIVKPVERDKLMEAIARLGLVQS